MCPPDSSFRDVEIQIRSEIIWFGRRDVEFAEFEWGGHKGSVCVCVYVCVREAPVESGPLRSPLPQPIALILKISFCFRRCILLVCHVKISLTAEFNAKSQPLATSPFPVSKAA